MIVKHQCLLVVGMTFWYVHCRVTKYWMIWTWVMSSLSCVQSYKSQLISKILFETWKFEGKLIEPLASCIVQVMFSFNVFFQVATCNSQSHIKLVLDFTIFVNCACNFGLGLLFKVLCALHFILLPTWACCAWDLGVWFWGVRDFGCDILSFWVCFV